jgi:hypothetical protein
MLGDYIFVTMHNSRLKFKVIADTTLVKPQLKFEISINVNCIMQNGNTGIYLIRLNKNA